MVVESPLTIAPPKAVPATGFDLTTLTAGRIVEARVTALAGQMATLASRHGPLEVDLGTARAAVGDVLRFEVRSIAGEDGQTTLQLALSSGSGEAKTAAPTAAVADPVQQALGRAVAKAVVNQSGLAPLYATLAGLASAPAGEVPEPIRALIGQLMGARLAASGPPTAKTVATAFRASGLFSESQAAAPDGETAATDLKATLASLRGALTQWVGPARPSVAAPAGGGTAPAANVAGGAAGASTDAAPESGAAPSSASGLAVRAAYGAAGGAGRASPMEPGTESGTARLAAFAYGGAALARAPGVAGPPPVATGASSPSVDVGRAAAGAGSGGAVTAGTMAPGATAAGGDASAGATRLGASGSEASPSSPSGAVTSSGAAATTTGATPTMPSSDRVSSTGGVATGGSPASGAATTTPAASPSSSASAAPATAATASTPTPTPAAGATSPASGAAPAAAPAEARTTGVPTQAPPPTTPQTTPAPATTSQTATTPTTTATSATTVTTGVPSAASAPSTAGAASSAAPAGADGGPATQAPGREAASGAGPAGPNTARATSSAGAVDRLGAAVAARPASADVASADGRGPATASVTTGAPSPAPAPATPAGAVPTDSATAATRGSAPGAVPPGPTTSASGTVVQPPLGRGEVGLLSGAGLDPALAAETGEAMIVAGRAAAARERGAKPPPPRKGQAPVAQAAAPTETASSDGVEGLGRRALERTEGALQRILLEQYVALDTHGDELVAGAARGNREWAAELPLATPNGTSIVQMTVERDGGGAGEREGATAGWRVRFALDVEPIGPVHAQIGLSGDHLSVGLWIERPEMAARLAEEVGQLTAALADSAMTVEPVRVQVGAPPAGRAEAGSTSGHFIDVSL
jgi:hypothetical protein